MMLKPGSFASCETVRNAQFYDRIREINAQAWFLEREIAAHKQTEDAAEALQVTLMSRVFPGHTRVVCERAL